MEHDNDDTLEMGIPEMIKPEPVKEIKKKKETNSLKCPKGFPQKKWDKWGDGAKRDYIRITGGTI